MKKVLTFDSPLPKHDDSKISNREHDFSKKKKNNNNINNDAKKVLNFETPSKTPAEFRTFKTFKSEQRKRLVRKVVKQRCRVKLPRLRITLVNQKRKKPKKLFIVGKNVQKVVKSPNTTRKEEIYGIVASLVEDFLIVHGHHEIAVELREFLQVYLPPLQGLTLANTYQLYNKCICCQVLARAWIRKYCQQSFANSW